MRYECNDVTYEATNLTEAWLMALNEQGLEAMESGSVCCLDNSDFCFHVCLDAYKRYFPKFTEEDFLQYEKVTSVAWLCFPIETHYEWDYDGKTKVTSLCQKGLDFILENSKLARYMDEIGFRW